MTSSTHTRQKRKVSERLHLFTEKIRLKYDLRREYFTVAVPVLVAVLLVVGSVLLGLTGVGGGGQEEKKSERQAAYEELMRQMEAEESGIELPEESGEEAGGEPAEKIGFDHILVYAALIAITPYAVDITVEKGRRRKKEELYTEFLFKLSEMMRGGLDPIKSVVELSRTDLGRLNDGVRAAANAMSFGKSFEEAMRGLASSLKSDLVERYTKLVVQASYSGGSVADLILKASEDMRGILSIEKEKEGNLKQYVLIFYLAQGIIVFITYTLSTSLLPFFQDMGGMSFGKHGADLSTINFTEGFFHLIMLNALFGGLIIGKISEGDTRHGLKHAVILMAGCYLASTMFLLPSSGPADIGPVAIEFVSGIDQEGIAGLPLQQPITVQVTDPDGNPLSRTTVTFEVKPGGVAHPATTKTNNEGMATMKVTLGAAEGTYTITATAGGTSRQITAVARAT
jgi:archaeal flagellar protein FlaJ